MSKMSPNDVLNALNNTAGGAEGMLSDGTLIRALAVAYAESGLDKDVVNPIGATGLFQINVPAHIKEHPDWTTQNMKDPQRNIGAAITLSNNWTNWKPWSAFTNNSYMLFVPQATTDVAAWHKKIRQPQGAAKIVNDTVQAAGGWQDVVSSLGQASTWQRVAYGVVGIGLIFVAISQISAVQSAAKTAGKVAML
jgi:hypothetical protein